MSNQSLPLRLPAPASLGPLAAEAVRRLLDIVVSLALILVLSPILVAIALAVRLTSPGPALFRQERVGHRGATFTMLKFRSMVSDADPAVHRDYVQRLLTGTADTQDGVYKLATDTRVTPIGALIRRTSLDELPQLFNVLAGHMTLVGPRPMIDYEVELLSAEHRRRFAVKPGMTGLWQVSGRNEVDMLGALDLDLEYLGRRTLLLDLQILLLTVPAVLVRRGAR